LILCEISCSSAPPLPAPPVPVQTVPRSLMNSIGDLLNNPLYSDVEFVFPPRNPSKKTRRIYAMKALLTRADYFSSLLNSGFAEGKTQLTASTAMEIEEDHPMEAVDTQATLTPIISHFPAYDSDFEDESDTDNDEDSEEEDDDDDESGTSEMQAEATLEMSVSEETAVIQPTSQNDQCSEVYSVIEVRQGEDADQNNASALTDSHLTPSWQSIGASDPGPSANNTVVTEPQVLSESRTAPESATHVPGPPKVKIEVKDVAYRTYLAMLHYLYTDSVTFAPLASTFAKEDKQKRDTLVIARNTPIPPSASTSAFENTASTTRPKASHSDKLTITSRKEWLRVWHGNNPPGVGPCSAKAMYQLADKLNLLDLKARAFKHIIKSMTVQNIPHEAFSSFSARFEEVRKVQVDYFLSNWGAIRSSDAMTNIWQQIRGGKHPGFEEVWPRIAMNLVFKPMTPEIEEVDVV